MQLYSQAELTLRSNMLNNDILRSLRYTLDLSDKRVIELIGDGGEQTARERLDSFLLKDTEEGHLVCPDVILSAFLNGLIRHLRGAREQRPPPEATLNNNLMMKKLRIAFNLRDEDVHQIASMAGSRLTRNEVNAIFQKPAHKNFKVCGDQLLRQFLSGLTRQYRPPDNPIYGNKPGNK